MLRSRIAFKLFRLIGSANGVLSLSLKPWEPEARTYGSVSCSVHRERPVTGAELVALFSLYLRKSTQVTEDRGVTVGAVRQAGNGMHGCLSNYRACPLNRDCGPLRSVETMSKNGGAT